jgi:ribosome biogenesis GTPase
MRERGIVIAGTGGVWRVHTDAGTTIDVSLRGRLKQDGDEKRARALKLAVGDRVQIERGARGDGWAIAAIEPRVSQLARREPGGRHGERILVANIDQVVIVFAAARPEPHLRMLDRFLVIAEANALRARIVINKIDLVDEPLVQTRFEEYGAAGYPVHFTSTVTRAGIPALREVLAGQTSALSGPSGVGKSSLLNCMYPGLDLRVGAVSEAAHKGQHTTVGAMLHPLPGGGAVVDTPGLREIGMWQIEPDHLDAYFPEFRPYLGECRFGDCVHRNEPGCAVREAVASGAVSSTRYTSSLKLLDEL